MIGDEETIGFGEGGNVARSLPGNVAKMLAVFTQAGGEETGESAFVAEWRFEAGA